MIEPAPENPCFGCGGANPRGMRLALDPDEARQRIVGRFRLARNTREARASFTAALSLPSSMR